MLGGKTTKKYYEGDNYFPPGEYDFLFDVEDESGIPKKIPFNNGDNPLVAAEKYIARENLPKPLYLQQIQTFLRNNTQGYGQKKTQSQPQTAKPKKNLEQTLLNEVSKFAENLKMTEEMKFTKLPNTQYNYYENMNLDGLSKKILEFNEKLLKESKKQHVLDEQLLKMFENWINVLRDKSFYHAIKIPKEEMKPLFEKLLVWPQDVIFPVYDLLRISVLHFNSTLLFSGLDNGVTYFSDIEKRMDEEPSDILANLGMQLISNLFLKSGIFFLLVM